MIVTCTESPLEVQMFRY